MSQNQNTNSVHHFLAFDLGATSGRAIIGTLSDGKLTSEEAYRFPNGVKEIDGKYYWDVFALFDHFIAAMKKVAASGIKIVPMFSASQAEPPRRPAASKRAIAL